MTEQLEFEALKQWHDIRAAINTQKWEQAWTQFSKEGAITKEQLGTDPNQSDKIFSFIKKESINQDLFIEMWNTWEYKYQEWDHKQKLTGEKDLLHKMLEAEQQKKSPTKKTEQVEGETPTPNPPSQPVDPLTDIQTKLEMRLKFSNQNKDKQQQANPIQAKWNVFADVKVEHHELNKDLAIQKFEAKEMLEKTDNENESQVVKQITGVTQLKPLGQKSYLKDGSNTNKTTFLNTTPSRDTTSKKQFQSPKTFLSSPEDNLTLSNQSKRREQMAKGFIHPEYETQTQQQEYGINKYKSLSPQIVLNRTGLDNLFNGWTTSRKNQYQPEQYRSNNTFYEKKSIQNKVQNIKEKLNRFSNGKNNVGKRRTD